MKIFVLLSIFLSLAVSANDMVDLTTWRQVGPTANGSWSVASNKSSVFQSINGHPTAFMSTETYDYRTFKGAIRVEDNGADDDYIGMILGDPSREFYLFVWKKGATGGVQNGFTLLKYSGTFNSVTAHGWPVFDRPLGPNTILAKKAGVGWTHNRYYDFEMQVYANRLVAKIDGQLIFDVSGLTIPKSRFGFFNWSQSAVRYNSIRQLHPPIAAHKSIELSQGTTQSITGTWTDGNQNDSHICQLLSSPEHGVVEFRQPCNMTFRPDPDVDGVYSFSYRVTDQDGLYTDGLVTANVLSLGTQFVWPHTTVAGTERIVDLELNATGTSDFPFPSLRLENKPDWISLRNNGELVLRPSLDDIGTYNDIRLFASNRLYANKLLAKLDIQVMAPPNSMDYLNQRFAIVPSEPVLYDQHGTQLATLKVPPLISHERNQVEGEHELIVVAGENNLSSITIGNTLVEPGQASSIDVFLDSKGTDIELNYASSLEGVSTLEFEFPWLDSPDDARYVIQRSCNSNDSSRCRSTLSMDRKYVGSGEIQAIFRSHSGDYSKYAFSSDDWQQSELNSAISNLSEGDILALNLNVIDVHSRAFILNVANTIRSPDLDAIIPNSAVSGTILYRHGEGVVDSAFNETHQWGVHRVNWLLPMP